MLAAAPTPFRAAICLILRLYFLGRNSSPAHSCLVCSPAVLAVPVQGFWQYGVDMKDIDFLPVSATQAYR